MYYLCIFAVVVTVVANVVVVVVVIAARFLLSLPMEVQFGKLFVKYMTFFVSRLGDTILL